MRKAIVDVIYNGINITKDISNEVVSFSYTDNAEGTADDVSLTLHNASKKWLTDWVPTTTDELEAAVFYDGKKLSCGKFIVDEVSYTGRPLTVSIRATSMPVDTNFSEVNKNKTWRKTTLKDIAQTIAGNSSIALKYEASKNPSLDFLSQVETSDKVFLYDQCQKFGLRMKLYSCELVIYDPVVSENESEIMVLHEYDMLSWSCSCSLTEAGYSGCRVQYTDPVSGEKVEHTESIPTGMSPKVYELNTTVENLSQAETVTKSQLHTLNTGQRTISFTVPGNPLLVAGVNITVLDLGDFNGKYYIDKASHSVGGGYTTAIEAHIV